MPRMKRTTDIESVKSKIIASIEIHPESGCWVWNKCRSKYGYGRVFAFGKVWSAHRLSYFVNVGAIPDGMCLCHICDNPPCCNPEHLFVGTKADNAKDRAAKGRSHRPRGTKNVTAKITDAIAIEMRNRHANGGVLLREIASEFGVSIDIVCRVVNRKSWTHI